ncbi:unnamed protein product [Mucor hiemalis]
MTSWKDLPVETLQLILNLLPSTHTTTIRECALVCRKWKSVVDHQLYTNVTISCIMRLSRFNRTITEMKISNFGQKCSFKDDLYEFDLNRNACLYMLLFNLPNLQQFTTTNPPCYTPITDALLESKLSRLRTLQEPKDNSLSNDYITCALLMKDCLKDITLVGQGVRFDRLYNRLQLFEKLEKVTVRRNATISMDELDLIIEKCGSALREVHVSFWKEWDDGPTTDADERDIHLYTPKPEIHTLSIKLKEEAHHSLLDYVMYKYTNLKMLRFAVESVKIMDKSTFERFIDYLSKIEETSVGSIVTDVKWICDNVGSYWEAMSLRQPKKPITLCIKHSGMQLSDSTNARLYLEDKSYSGWTAITFPFCNYGLEDMNLFERYGQHISSLIIQGFSKKLTWGDSNEGDTVLEKLIASILMFSEKLERLTITECDVNRTDESIVIERTSLKHLEFNSCDIGSRVFEKFIGGMDYIDRLTLDKCKNRNQDNNLTSFISINMPHTSIGELFIHEPKNPHRGSRYLLLSLTKYPEVAKGEFERIKTYYKHDFKMGYSDCFKEISETEYHDEKYAVCTHFDVSCKSIDSFRVLTGYFTIRLRGEYD